MRGLLGTAVALAVFFLGANLAGQPEISGSTTAGEANARAKQENATGDPAQVKVIEMTAKKYEYSPSEIHVKKGTRVRLKVRALDRTHGFKIKPFSEGAAKGAQPGLRLVEQQDNWKIEKQQERVIEFVAERAGTYLFKCSVFCGLGHGGMKGKLVVED